MGKILSCLGFLLVLFIGSAQAQQVNLYCNSGTTGTGALIWTPASSTNPCFAGGGVSGNLGNNVDGVAPVATGNIGSDSYLYGYDTVSGKWNRASLIDLNNEVIPSAPASLYVPIVGSALLAFSGNDYVGLNVLYGDADALATGNGSLLTENGNLEFNGTTWDRRRNNIDTAALITLAAQAAGTVNSVDQTNYNSRGVKIVFNPATDTTCSSVVTIQGKDAASGVYYTLLAGAAVTNTTPVVYTVYPGITATTNVSASDILPRTWHVSITLTGVSCAVTGTIGASVIN